MAGPMSIQCPKCKAKLKLKGTSSIGKKVACPKCKQPFVVPAPKKRKPRAAESSNFLNVNLSDYQDGDPADDDFGTPEESYQPARSRQRATAQRGTARRGSKKKHPNRKSGNRNPAVFIGGGILALALIGIAIFLFTRDFSGENPFQVEVPAEENRIDLAYLPADAELIVRVELADLTKAALIKDLLAKPEVGDTLRDLTAKTGLKLNDIESITVGIAGISEATKYQKDQLASLDLQSPDQMQANMQKMRQIQEKVGQMYKAVLVIRATKSLDEEKLTLLSDNGQVTSHQEKSYYRLNSIPVLPTSMKGAAYFADPSTMILGTEPEIKAAIENGARSERREDLDFVDPQQRFLLAMVPHDKTLFDNDAMMQQQYNPLSKLLPQSETKQKQSPKTNGFSLGLVVSNTVGMQFRMDFQSDSDARQSKSDGSNGLEELRKKFQQNREAMSQQMPIIAEVIQKTLDSVTLDLDGSVLEVQATLPKSIASVADEMPQAMAYLMFAGGGMPTQISSTQPQVSLSTDLTSQIPEFPTVPGDDTENLPDADAADPPEPKEINVGLSIGDRAPEIEGRDLNLAKFKLSDYRGKVIMLDFWGNW